MFKRFLLAVLALAMLVMAACTGGSTEVASTKIAEKPRSGYGYKLSDGYVTLIQDNVDRHGAALLARIKQAPDYRVGFYQAGDTQPPLAPNSNPEGLLGYRAVLNGIDVVVVAMVSPQKTNYHAVALQKPGSNLLHKLIGTHRPIGGPDNALGEPNPQFDSLCDVEAAGPAGPEKYGFTVMDENAYPYREIKDSNKAPGVEPLNLTKAQDETKKCLSMFDTFASNIK